MRTYIVNGIERRYADGEAPEGAVLKVKAVVKAEPKPEPVKEEKPKSRKTSNKSKKVEANK